MDVDLIYNGLAYRRITRDDLTHSIVKLLMFIDGIEVSPEDYADSLVYGELGECWVKVEFAEPDDDG